MYNVVCCCAGRSMQDRPLEANETKAVFDSNAELVRRFKDWEPRVKKIVDYAKNVSQPFSSPVICTLTVL